MKRIKNRLGFIFWCLMLAFVLSGCEDEPVSSDSSSPSPSPTPAASEAASPAPSPGTGGGSLELERKSGPSIAVGRVFDAAGYGWKPGISYAIRADGSAWAWGYGQQEYAVYPKELQAERPIVQISNSYLLTDEGQVRRIDADGGIALVEGLDDAVAIQQLDEMFGTLFVLKQDGTVWVLQRDSGKIERFGDASSITAIYGTSFSLFLQDSNGRLLYANGQDGNIMEPASTTELLPEGVEQVFAAYDDQALIRLVSGQVYRYSSHDQTLTPEPRLDEAVKMAIVADSLYLFTKEDGTVWGFGRNADGILGEEADLAEEPVQIPGLSGIADIQGGTNHVLALDGNDRIYSWGSNMTGQLGRLELIYDKWTELGELQQVSQAILLDHPYFVQENGTVWSMERDLSLIQLKDLANIQELTDVSGIPLSLSKDGEIKIWSKRFEASEPLLLPFKVKRMAGMDQNLLVQTREGELQLIDFEVKYSEANGRRTVQAIIPGTPQTVLAEEAWTTGIKSLHANPYTFLALTEDGKVFYMDREKDRSLVLKQVMELPSVVALAAEYFVRYTAEPAQVWALDEQGRTYQITVEAEVDRESILSVTARSEGELENGVAVVSGRLRISQDGHVYEFGKEQQTRQQLPHPIRKVFSAYSYAIEGPGSHAHLLIAENGKIGVIGYNPFGAGSSQPEEVQFP